MLYAHDNNVSKARYFKGAIGKDVYSRQLLYSKLKNC